MSPPPQRQQKNKAQIADEEYRCYQMKLTGANHRQIAAEVGISVGTVHTRITKYIKATVAPEAELYRQLIIDRAERLLLKTEPGVDAGDPKAIATALKIIDSLFRYNGLESIKVEHSGFVSTSSAIDQELQSLANELGLNDNVPF